MDTSCTHHQVVTHCPEIDTKQSAGSSADRWRTSPSSINTSPSQCLTVQAHTSNTVFQPGPATNPPSHPTNNDQEMHIHAGASLTSLSIHLSLNNTSMSNAVCSALSPHAPSHISMQYSGPNLQIAPASLLHLHHQIPILLHDQAVAFFK